MRPSGSGGPPLNPSSRSIPCHPRLVSSRFGGFRRCSPHRSEVCRRRPSQSVHRLDPALGRGCASRWWFPSFLLPRPPSVRLRPAPTPCWLSSHADENYGATSILAVQKGITSVIQFNLSGVPAGTTIRESLAAALHRRGAVAGLLRRSRVDSPSSENTVSAQNAPMIGASATGGNPVPISRASRNNFVLVESRLWRRAGSAARWPTTALPCS